MTLRKLSILFVLTLFVVGCGSTEKKFKRGVEAEERGEYLLAANYFITVLQKAPDYAPAVEHLETSGAAAIEFGVADARERERNADYAGAADILDQLADLTRRADQVGTRLILPDDFDALRDSLEEQAFNQLIAQAEAAVAAGRWNDALVEYERAIQRSTPNQQANIEEAMAGVHVRWAESLMAQLRYQAAFGQAQYAIDALGISHPIGQQAMALQEQALIDGTRIVVFLPLGQTEGMRRTAPGNFLDDLNDVLLYDSWSIPPPFLGAVDNVEVRRELRRVVGRGSAVVSRGDALEVGRILGSDMVVSGELVDFSVDERRVKTKTKKVKTMGRNPVDTTFTIKEFTLYLDAAVEFRIYDTHDRSVIYEGVAEASTSQKVERGEYPGDYRDLDLSSKQRDYFDRDQHEREMQVLEEQLADELSVKIATRVFERALRQVD